MSTYTLTIAGQATDFARATKATVVAAADAARKSGERAEITVVTAAGNAVYTLKEVKARVITKRTRPFTKTIALPEDLAALVAEGYVAAYERPRNDTVVLRNEGAEQEERYAVTRRSTGEFLGFAETTREAGQIQKTEKVKA